MAEDQADDGDDDIFVYMGGRAPQHVINAIIDESVKEIDDDAFCDNPNLRSVEFHDGVDKIGTRAFISCTSLRRIIIPGVKVIGMGTFYNCSGLEDVKFGDKLETIGQEAFEFCTSLRCITMPSIRTIAGWAFEGCTALTDAEFGGVLEKIYPAVFRGCSSLRRIAIPLKDGIFHLDDHHQRYNSLQSYNQLDGCINLTTVDLVGGIHKTVASLHLKSWRNEMREDINRINRVLSSEQTNEIRQWIQSVIRRIEHYKTEHSNLLREATTLLELALWKAKLDEEEGGARHGEAPAKRVKLDVEGTRKGARITSGASIVIKNVFPFLELG